MSSGLYELEFNEGISTLTNNQIIWESTSLSRVVYPETITNIAGINASTHSNNLTTVVSYAKTPPTLGSTSYISGSTYFYVPNESLKAYRLKAAWNSYDGRVLGFFNGPSNFYADGTYTYSLRSVFNGYTNLQYYLEPNDYVTMSVTNDSAVLVCSGINQDTNSEAHLSYSFVYKGRSVSGTIDIPIAYKGVIDFEDAEVKRICVNNWGGEYNASSNLYGVPGELTYEQAAAVTSIGKVFNGNTKITSFMEFQYFTSLIGNSLYAAATQNIPFYNCRNLKKIKVPEGITYINGLFRNCASLVFIELPSTLTGTDTIRYYTFGGNPSTPANKKLVVHFNHPFTLTANGAYGTYCGTFNRGIYVPDEYIDEFKAADVWKNNNIYPLSEWDGTT